MRCRACVLRWAGTVTGPELPSNPLGIVLHEYARVRRRWRVAVAAAVTGNLAAVARVLAWAPARQQARGVASWLALSLLTLVAVCAACRCQAELARLARVTNALARRACRRSRAP